MQRQLQLKKESGRSVSTSKLAFTLCPCFARYPIHLKTCIHVLSICDTVQLLSRTQHWEPFHCTASLLRCHVLSGSQANKAGDHCAGRSGCPSPGLG